MGDLIKPFVKSPSIPEQWVLCNYAQLPELFSYIIFNDYGCKILDSDACNK